MALKRVISCGFKITGIDEEKTKYITEYYEQFDKRYCNTKNINDEKFEREIIPILEKQGFFSTKRNAISTSNNRSIVNDLNEYFSKDTLSFSQWEKLVGGCTNSCYCHEPFYNEIINIAKKYKEAGYDVILNYYCDDCIKQNKGLHSVEFGIRFDKKEKYHYSYPIYAFPKNGETRLPYYRMVFEFLQGTQNYSGLIIGKWHNIFENINVDKIKIEKALSKILGIKITYDKTEIRKMINMLIINQLSDYIPQKHLLPEDILKDDLDRYFVPIKDYDKCIFAKEICKQLLEETDDNFLFNLDEICAINNLVLFVTKPNDYYQTEDVLHSIESICKNIHKKFTIGDMIFCIHYLNIHEYEDELILAIEKYTEKNNLDLIIDYSKFNEIINSFFKMKTDIFDKNGSANIIDDLADMIKRVIEGDK